MLEGLAMEDVGIFYGHLVHFMVIFPVLVFCSKKNLATLLRSKTSKRDFGLPSCDSVESS
jgi:hypothetical protein